MAPIVVEVTETELTTEVLMKKLIATLCFSIFATICSAQVVTGSGSVVSGARWTITNISVQPSNLFYVGLEKVSSNLLALDLVFNNLRFLRFSTYGDFGASAGGTDIRHFSGSGYLFPSGLVHLNLIDSFVANWDCYLNANLSGTCRVYDSSGSDIGEVRLSWSP